MGIIGWISAAVYLLLSLQALYPSKGRLRVIGSLAGPIAFFPIWAAILFDFNDPIIWGTFFICLIDAFMTKNKLEKKQVSTADTKPSKSKISSEPIKNKNVQENDKKEDQRKSFFPWISIDSFRNE